jgi:glycosyltransferase involved in cell wall biosynthesis
MPKTLLIDGLSLLGQVSGVGRYCHEISSRIPEELFERYYYYGYVTKALHSPAADSALSRVKRAACFFRPVKALARKCLTWTAHRGTWDLHWQPNFIPVRSIHARHVVTTVHDFAWEVYPHFQTDERVAYFQKYFYPGLECCDRIITVSEFVKTELLQRVPHLADRIEVIHNGFDGSVYSPAPPVSRQGNYLLSVGSIEPRKNILNLLKAYALLDPATRREFPLLLVGAAGWKNAEIFRMVAALEGSVRYLGYVGDEALADYYRGARCFIYPSFYEGFGLPPLEAMACGTPVIVSRVSSLPEVCGEAAYYADPEDVEAIRDAILAFVHDDLLRERHARLGVARAARFSWERSAAAHTALFRDVTGG